MRFLSWFFPSWNIYWYENFLRLPKKNRVHTETSMSIKYTGNELKQKEIWVEEGGEGRSEKKKQ